MTVVNVRAKNRSASRSSLLIAIGVHLIIGILLYQQPDIRIKIDEMTGHLPAIPALPKAPEKPPMNKVKPMNLPPTSVRFDVTNKPRTDPGFTATFKDLSSISLDGPTPTYTAQAQKHDIRNVPTFRAEITKTTRAVLDIFIPEDFNRNHRTSVIEVGRRMRARLNLCLLATPGSTVLGKIGRSTNGAPDTAVNYSRVTWDYIFRKYNSIDRARAWLKENTQIQVTENTITLNAENTFTDWLYNIRKKGALSVDSTSTYFEQVASKQLEHAVEAVERNKISGRRDFVQLTQSAVFNYITRKYDIESAEAIPVDILIKKIEDRNVLRDWRKRGLQEIVTTAKGLNADTPEEALTGSLYPLYSFFRKAQALENPLLIISNVQGLSQVAEENMEQLRNYVKNGGFIWIDETGVATGNIKNQHNIARGFIAELMKFDQRLDMTEKETETFKKLSSDDRAVQGYVLGEPFPAFAHPQAFIPITLPQDGAVTIRIFNRLGIPVKQFVWAKDKPMKAGAYIKKEMALAWNCDNDAGEPVESGVYFIQMQAGLYQSTRTVRVSKLRMLDEKHPLMSVVHTFRNVPVCTIENSSTFWDTRPYGNAAFGYYLNGRMVLLYTEGAGLTAGLGDLNNAVGKDLASKFLNNIIAFCLSDEDGVAIRP